MKTILRGKTSEVVIDRNGPVITAAIRATDLILGRDDFAMRFVENFQANKE